VKRSPSWSPTGAISALKGINPKLNLGAFVFPGATASATALAVSPTDALAVSKTSRNLPAALAFADFVASGGGSELYTKITGDLSVQQAATGRNLPPELTGISAALTRTNRIFPLIQIEWKNGEVYTALKTGLVDAAENNYPSYESSRHFEVAKYYNKTEHSMAPEILLFSKKVWDTLSADEQKQIRAAAKESVVYMRKLWDEREAKSLAIVKAGGAEIVDVDKAPFQAAMKPVYDKFLKDPKLQDMVKRINAVK